MFPGYWRTCAAEPLRLAQVPAEQRSPSQRRFVAQVKSAFAPPVLATLGIGGQYSAFTYIALYRKVFKCVYGNWLSKRCAYAGLNIHCRKVIVIPIVRGCVVP